MPGQLLACKRLLPSFSVASSSMTKRRGKGCVAHAPVPGLVLDCYRRCPLSLHSSPVPTVQMRKQAQSGLVPGRAKSNWQANPELPGLKVSSTPLPFVWRLNLCPLFGAWDPKSCPPRHPGWAPLGAAAQPAVTVQPECQQPPWLRLVPCV